MPLCDDCRTPTCDRCGQPTQPRSTLDDPEPPMVAVAIALTILLAIVFLCGYYVGVT